MKSEFVLLAVASLLSACQVRQSSVLDVFPDTGVNPGSGKTVCSFDYQSSGSAWVDGIHEEDVFFASIQSEDWTLGIGKGGQIYSLRGPYGESIPPQRVESPWNDEVWQTVVTSEELVGPVHEFHGANPGTWSQIKPLLYFVHQSGIYVKGAAKGHDSGTVAAPFYSPCLRKQWNAETKTLKTVNWMQQANTPCVWKSGVLIYTAYRDCGNGVIEANQVLHNFGTETLTFMNIPWGGVRKTSLPQTIMSNSDGSWEVVGGLYGWTDIPTRHLVDTGGWQAWTQDSTQEESPSLALVFGTDIEDSSNGKRKDEAVRWGTSGNVARDYEVTERMTHAKAGVGDSLWIRWYLVSGEFSKVRETAADLSAKAGVCTIDFDNDVKQPVWIEEGKVVTEGQGKPWIELSAFPLKGTVPVFLLEDERSGEQLITADPYALSETEPYPNPIPEDSEIHEIYNDRVVYKQYAPHIGYKNLLGYAFKKKPTDLESEKLSVPFIKKLSLDAEAANLWISAEK